MMKYLAAAILLSLAVIGTNADAASLCSASNDPVSGTWNSCPANQVRVWYRDGQPQTCRRNNVNDTLNCLGGLAPSQYTHFSYRSGTSVSTGTVHVGTWHHSGCPAGARQPGIFLSTACEPIAPPVSCPLNIGDQIDVTKSDADAVRPQYACVEVNHPTAGTAKCRVEKVSDIGITLSAGSLISHRLVYKVAESPCISGVDPEMQKFDDGCLVSGGLTLCPDMTPQKKNCGTVDGDEVCAEVGPDNCGEVNGVKQCADIPTGCGMVNGDNICPPTTPTGCGTVNGTQVCPQALPNGQPFCVTTAAGNSVCSTQINEGTACVTTSAGNVHCTTFRNAPNTSPPKPDTGTPGQPAAPNSTVGAIGNGSTTTVNTYNSSTVNNSTHQGGGGGGSGGEGEGEACEGADCKPCGGPGQPECRVKINEAGTPASGSATSAAAAAGQKHQKDSDDFMTAAKALARGQGDDEAENFDSKSDEVKSGFLDKLSFLESSPACQQVTGTFSGKEFVFPGPAGCDRLERLKQIIGMAFFAYTILALAHVATAPKE